MTAKRQPKPKRTDLPYLKGWFHAGGASHRLAADLAKEYRRKHVR